MTRSTTRVALLAVLALFVPASGCATVPTSGNVRSDGPAGAAPIQEVVNVLAQSPRPGATPDAIVNGFLEAMINPLSRDTARQYLTPDAAAAWQPDTRTWIYDPADSMKPGKGHNQLLSAPLLASFDARGAWQPAKPGERLKFEFVLTEVAAGEYRIAKAPPGVFLDKYLSERNYDTRNLYFVAPAGDLLVPDPIYVPLNWTRSQLANLLVESLLAGPTSRLGDAVRTAIPPNTKLNVAVTVDEAGVATVDLSDTVGGLGPVDRERLAAQVTWTLRSVTSQVRITVNGAPLVEGDEEMAYDDYAQYDPSVPAADLTQLYVLKQGKINRVEGLDGSSEIQTRPQEDSLLSNYQAKSFAVSMRSELGAIVTDGQVVVGELARNGSNSKENKYATSGRVTRPTFDWQGNLWWVERADSASPQVWMRDVDAKAHRVDADFGGGRVRTLRVAPDGVRVLAVVEKAGKSAVLVGRIKTADTSEPKMEGFQSLRLPYQDIGDATWSKPDRFTVVGREAAGKNRQPWEVNIDGSLPVPVAGVSSIDVQAVATAPNLETLLVLQDTRERLQRRSRDLQWENPLGDTPPPLYPAYPG